MICCHCRQDLAYGQELVECTFCHIFMCIDCIIDHPESHKDAAVSVELKAIRGDTSLKSCSKCDYLTAQYHWCPECSFCVCVRCWSAPVARSHAHRDYHVTMPGADEPIVRSDYCCLSPSIAHCSACMEGLTLRDAIHICKACSEHCREHAFFCSPCSSKPHNGHNVSHNTKQLHLQLAREANSPSFRCLHCNAGFRNFIEALDHCHNSIIWTRSVAEVEHTLIQTYRACVRKKIRLDDFRPHVQRPWTCHICNNDFESAAYCCNECKHAFRVCEHCFGNFIVHRHGQPSFVRTGITHTEIPLQQFSRASPAYPRQDLGLDGTNIKSHPPNVNGHGRPSLSTSSAPPSFLASRAEETRPPLPSRATTGVMPAYVTPDARYGDLPDSVPRKRTTFKEKAIKLSKNPTFRKRAFQGAKIVGIVGLTALGANLDDANGFVDMFSGSDDVVDMDNDLSEYNDPVATTATSDVWQTQDPMLGQGTDIGSSQGNLPAPGADTTSWMQNQMWNHVTLPQTGWANNPSMLNPTL